MKWTDWILNLLFPPRCPFCGKIRDAAEVCPDCRRELSWTESPEQVQALGDGLLCVSPMWYEGRVREGLLRFKFHGVTAAAEDLAVPLVQRAAEHLGGEFDVVSWVPVSAKRLRKRGYDQAYLLAEAACRHWDTRPERLLEKVRNNPAQSGTKSAERRKTNVQGVYQALPSARGRRVLLIDDIVTTGSTLRECARTLYAAGAERVVCATAARTRSGRGEDGRALRGQ